MLDKTLANVTQQIYAPGAGPGATSLTRLFVVAGPLVGANFVLAGDKTTIGRSPDCSIQIDTAGVSRKHCKLEREGDRVFVTDLESANGTIVNGRAMQPLSRTQLQHGDRLAVLDTEFFFLSPRATADAVENELDVNFTKAATEAAGFLDDFPEILSLRQKKLGK